MSPLTTYCLSHIRANPGCSAEQVHDVLSKRTGRLFFAPSIEQVWLAIAELEHAKQIRGEYERGPEMGGPPRRRLYFPLVGVST